MVDEAVHLWDRHSYGYISVSLATELAVGSLTCSWSLLASGRPGVIPTILLFCCAQRDVVWLASLLTAYTPESPQCPVMDYCFSLICLVVGKQFSLMTSCKQSVSPSTLTLFPRLRSLFSILSMRLRPPIVPGFHSTIAGRCSIAQWHNRQSLSASHTNESCLMPLAHTYCISHRSVIILAIFKRSDNTFMLFLWNSTSSVSLYHDKLY